MSKKKGGKKMAPSTASNVIPLTPKTKLKSTKKTRFSSMSNNDWKEANEVTKRGRGLSGMSFTDVYGEDK